MWSSLIYLISFVFLLARRSSAQGNPTLGLQDGYINLSSPSFAIRLVKDSQTLASLKPKPEFPNNALFDFVPFDQLTLRQYNGNYHLGDVTFRARIAGTTNWTSGDSSANRFPVTALQVNGTTLAAANLSPTLPANSLLNITRRWTLVNNNLNLLFDVSNHQTSAVEIGSFGIPMEWNNIFTGRTAADVNQNCSLFDPYIGMNAGFVQVTPLIGTAPALVITPANTDSPFEGWRFLPENTANPPYYQSQTFEGLYEWQTHTLAYAQNEWVNVTPWNAPTSRTLQPGQTVTFGLQLQLSPSIREIENTVHSAGVPVAVGVPGYVLPSDQIGKLFLNYSSKVESISVSPAGALTLAPNTDSSTGWMGYDVTPVTWGRSRLTIEYANGVIQTVNYFVQTESANVIARLGQFLTTSQWYTNSSDPFGRASSVITYDRSVNAPVVNDPRVWIAGLSDEGGAGSWLAATVKQFVQPNAQELVKIQAFAADTLLGTIQNENGTVKKSVFFYQPGAVEYSYPSSIDWGNWWSWNEAAAYSYSRAYDYVHVTSAWWSLYRVARNYPTLLPLSWETYLTRAFNTVSAMMNPVNQVGYIDDGLMEETVFSFLLNDLVREGWTANATAFTGYMRSRYEVWAGERYPFGSEQAWDSTGQEGVYVWSKYFNDTTTSTNALNSILAYDPLIPHWGYNGNARRYWDFIYAGKLMRYERQIHHYGSGLNALPLIEQFMADPTDIYLLRVGFGGISGTLTNVDQGGFAAAAFHSFPQTLAWDGYSGDYGPNFVGHSLGMATFIIDHPDFGWQAFGGNVESTSPTVQVQAADSVRRRVFLAPIGTLFSLDAGAFSTIEFSNSTGMVTFNILPAPEGISGAAQAPFARVVVKQTAEITGVTNIRPTNSSMTSVAGAYTVPFNSGIATITFSTK